MDIVTIPHLANLARRKYEALCLVIRRKHSPAGVSISRQHPADLATVPPFPPTGNVVPE